MTFRLHWRTVAVFMLLFAVSYALPPGLQVVYLVLWAVGFGLVMRRHAALRRHEGDDRRFRRRRRWTLVAAASVAAALAVGLLFPTDVWRVEVKGDRLKLSVLQPSEEDGAVLFEDDFSDRGGEWNVRDTPDALVEYSGGGLRMVVRDVGTINYEIHALPADVERLRIETDMTVLAGGDGLTVGLLCGISAGLDAQRAGARGAYVALLEPTGRRIGIGRVRPPLGKGFFESTEQLSDSTLPDGDPLGQTVRLAAECRGGDGNGRRDVSFWVNGSRAATGSHTAAAARFDGIGLIVFSGPNEAIDVRFDNVVARDLDG